MKDLLFQGEENLKERIEESLENARLLPVVPLGTLPLVLQNLHPYKAPHDLGMLGYVEHGGDVFLKNIPARTLVASPLDRAGLIYTLTIIYLDADGGLHNVEIDMEKSTDTPELFQARLTGVAQMATRLFAEAYLAHENKEEVEQPKAKSIDEPMTELPKQSIDAPSKQSKDPRAPTGHK